MLELSPDMSFNISVDPIDFRCGIDKLICISSKLFDEDPRSCNLFVYRNRSSTCAKILFYDGSGFWLCQKRLSRSKFSYWPSSVAESKQISKLDLIRILKGFSI